MRLYQQTDMSGSLSQQPSHCAWCGPSLSNSCFTAQNLLDWLLASSFGNDENGVDFEGAYDQGRGQMGDARYSMEGNFM